MITKTRKSIWQLLSLTGLIGVLFYTAHVLIGGFLWQGYSHLSQTISELTANGAPDAGFLSILTTIYGILMIIFSVSLYFIFRALEVKNVARIGAILLIVMEVTSLGGYSFFPLDEAGSTMNFQNIMHIVVTAVVVLTTLSCFYFTGIGLLKTPGFSKIGRFVLIMAVIITVAGFATPMTMASGLPFSGLVERLNIFSIQTCLSVLSIYFFLRQKPVVVETIKD